MTRLDLSPEQAERGDKPDHSGFCYRVFGITLASTVPLPGLLPAHVSAIPDLEFSVSREPLEGAPTDRPEPVFLAASGTNAESGASYVYRLSDRDILGHGGAYEFHVQPERIHCHLLDSEDLDRIALALLGSVMAYWLEVRGRIALHAAAVEVDGLAVAFLAGNTGGKSSLAATFMQAGFPLLTDDILPLEVGSDGRATGHPGLPQLRFWPEHGRALLGNSYDFQPVHPLLEKRRVVVGGEGGGFGRFTDRELPLDRIYLPRLMDVRTGDGPTRISRMQPQQAMIELIRNSFSAPVVDAIGMQKDRLARLSALASATPLYTISYPRGLARLADVRATIIAHGKRDQRTGRRQFTFGSPHE